MNNTAKGIVYALIAAIISGIAIFYAKVSVAKIDPLILTTSRNLFAGLLLLITIIFSYKKEIKINFSIKNVSKLLIISIIGGSIPFFLFFTGLKLIGPQTANLIQKSLFIWVGILSLVFLKEKLNPVYWLAFTLIFIGNFVINPVSIVFDKGIILVILATMFWSVENVLVKKFMQNFSEKLLSVVRMLGGGLILLCMTITTGKLSLLFSLNFDQLITIIVGGIILSFYVYFWYKALKYAPASLVTLILTFSLVVGNILNGAFIGIKLTTNDIFSSILIGVAMVLLISNIKYQISKLQFKT